MINVALRNAWYKNKQLLKLGKFCIFFLSVKTNLLIYNSLNFPTGIAEKENIIPYTNYVMYIFKNTKLCCTNMEIWLFNEKLMAHFAISR